MPRPNGCHRFRASERRPRTSPQPPRARRGVRHRLAPLRPRPGPSRSPKPDSTLLLNPQSSTPIVTAEHPPLRPFRMRPIDRRQPGPVRLGPHGGRIAFSAHRLAPPQLNAHPMQHLPRIDRPFSSAHRQRTDPIPRQPPRTVGRVFESHPSHPQRREQGPPVPPRPPRQGPRTPHHDPIRPVSAPNANSSTQHPISATLIENLTFVPHGAPAAHRRRTHPIPPDPPRSARTDQPAPEHDRKSDRRFRAPAPIDFTQRLIYQVLTSEKSARHPSAPPAHRIDLDRPIRLGRLAEPLP